MKAYMFQIYRQHAFPLPAPHGSHVRSIALEMASVALADRGFPSRPGEDHEQHLLAAVACQNVSLGNAFVTAQERAMALNRCWPQGLRFQFFERMLDPGWEPIDKPKTSKDADDDGWVEGVVEIDILKFVDDCESHDYESFLDALSCKLVGNELLMDFSYQMVGCDIENGLVHFLVKGDSSMAFERSDEDEDEN